MRNILHVDMNCFYASVEMMLNPSLEGRPVAVGGNTEDRHGIVLAKSDPAKKMGVKTGDSLCEARQKCPDLLVVPPHYEIYEALSLQAREIYNQYSDRVEPYGLDECWLDVTHPQSASPERPRRLAQEIQGRVYRELGLRLSAGVSFTKIFAKMGSDRAPRAGVLEITEDTYRRQLWPLPLRALPGVGRATEARFARCNIRTVGALAQTSPGYCRLILGKNGEKLWLRANGRDGEMVQRTTDLPRPKSMGRGITLRQDIFEENEAHRIFLYLSQRVIEALVAEDMTGYLLTLAIRGDDLQWESYTRRSSVPLDTAMEIRKTALALYREKKLEGRAIRAVSLRIQDLVSRKTLRQRSLFDDPQREKRVELEETLRQLRKRYGRASIDYAALKTDSKLPYSVSDICTLPGSRKGEHYEEEPPL